ncbi:33617_t:CDS:1, partial [Racocetra persica]
GVDPARTKNHICARPVQSCRTLEEPMMEIFGHPYSSIKELSEKAKQLAKNVVSPFYKAKSEKYWYLYEKFCKKFGLDMKNPLEEGILAFIMWLDVTGLELQTPRVLQVVVNNLRFEGKEDFRKSLAITQVLRAIKKKASKNKTPDWPRDPLPIIALRYYMDMPPYRANVSMYKRDIALVALGLRTMRRSGELGSLTLEDIKWDNDGTLWV